MCSSRASRSVACWQKARRTLRYFGRTDEVKAKAAPNLQTRKWLNFQEKIDRKSKVSKVDGVETVETVEGAEVTRIGEDGGVPSCYLRSKLSGPIHSGMPRVPRVISWSHQVQETVGVLEP